MPEPEKAKGGLVTGPIVRLLGEDGCTLILPPRRK